MKKYHFLAVLIFGILGWMTSCGQSSSKTENLEPQKAETEVVANDSVAISQAFEQLKTDKTFLKDLGLETEKHFAWNNLHRLFRGDLDGDEIEDVLLAFSIEGRGRGNNFDAHFAAFLNKNKEWKYGGQLDANIFAEDRFLEIDKIENGIIKGNWVGNKNESLTPFQAEYLLKNGKFINTFTALHKTENVEREYLYVAEILTPENSLVPLTATAKEYEKLLGKGKISTPKEQPECGAYFDEGLTRYLDYADLQFELSDQNDAALVEIQFKKEFRMQTDKGTINENTTREDLKNCFYKKESWMVYDEENGLKVFPFPTAPNRITNGNLHLIRRAS
ncbi:hypothetical protein G6R40_03310 [Chryseobacterium sp. POL2]|uniref:hypothetical protein n=1 Tax=Chryseobacterium sp. POL2 TaxID=2713414 RepID=UPI0013E1560E|nr:hypothetical protein [Chryseobacterium sp. POL2]QIG88757.1 hypothetical protein G6R40_03310 [Chryseobacterium sp. POL2]